MNPSTSILVSKKQAKIGLAHSGDCNSKINLNLKKREPQESAKRGLY